MRPWLWVCVGVTVAVAGFVTHAMWRVLPVERFVLSILLSAISLALASALRNVFGLSWASAIAAVWVAALVVYVGITPLVAVAAIGIAAYALGARLAPARADAAVTWVLGIVVLGTVASWVITWPVHFAAIWWTVILALIVWSRRLLREDFARMCARWRASVANAPRAAAGTVVLLGLASTACWLPVMQMDDLSYHLGLPTQLLLDGRYRPDPAHQVWAYAPWLGDVLHGIAGVMSRRESHAAINAMWLVAGAAAAWSFARRWTSSPIERWTAVACFASFPPLVWMAAGMQTELAATAVTLALAACVSARAERMAAPTAALAGATFALKLMHGMAALPLVLIALFRTRDAWSWRGALTALSVFLFVASSSYVQAWLATDNPVLPLFNALFQSAYVPLESYRDPRWFSGVSIDLPMRLIFDTDRYVEAWDGALGFAPLILGGAFVVSLARPRLRVVALAIMACAAAPLVAMQYARYAYPGIALLCVLLPIGLRAMAGRRAFAALVIAVCISNVAYQANASWLHHSAAIKRAIRNPGNPDEVLRHYVPERILVRRVPRDSSELVLMTTPARSVAAELAGRGRTVSDHDPKLNHAAASAERDPSGAGWATLICDERISWLIVIPRSTSDALKAGLKRIAARREAALGDAELWHAARACAPR